MPENGERRKGEEEDKRNVRKREGRSCRAEKGGKEERGGGREKECEEEGRKML